MKLKKIVSALLAALMLCSCFMIGTASAADDEGLPFKDVGKKKWFYDEVKYVYEKKLMTGTSDTKFEPNGSLTRAMFVTILGRLAGADTSETNKFSDVKSGKWYSGYVGWGVDAGIVNGYEDGTFKPNKPLSREEMAACISRYIDYMELNMPRANDVPYVFSDSAKIAKWARDYVDVLRRSGIVKGDQYVNYNPKASITRAEMATIIMNLIGAEEMAWQGYAPNPESDGYGVYGANYIYWNGTVFTDYRAKDEFDWSRYVPLFEDFKGLDLITEGLPYPALSAPTSAKTGISCEVAEIDIRETPIVKVCYKYENRDPDESLTGEININVKNMSWAYLTEKLTFTDGAADEGWKTATVDISSFVQANPTIQYDVGNRDNDYPYIIVTPKDDGGSFMVRYFAFFKDQASADAFKSADMEDYLNNYYVYTEVDYGELTDEKRKEYDNILAKRIEEIKNSESAVTPEMITAAGGTAYYIANDGDDANKGTSPEAPWKTIDNQWEYKAGGKVQLPKLKPGDGLFFKRGDEWYAEQYNNSTVTGLSTAPGVTYGAYGEGEKPLISCAVDFRDKNNVGVWLETEWEDVYVLDQLDVNPEWCRGDKCDIGSIIFNDGEFIGIRVRPSDREDLVVFGEGKRTDVAGIQCNGKDIFYSGGTTCMDPGDALRNDLEFIYDSDGGKLYLKCDDGNPADVFDDIKVARSGYTVGCDVNVRIDSLAIKHSTCWGITYCDGCVITNCEIAFCGGSISSIGSGIECYGEGSGMRVENNYIHDVEDGPITNQSADNDPTTPAVIIENIEYANNVIVACGNGSEVWNHYGGHTDGIPKNQLKNVHIHDNIMAYMGYGFTLQQATGNSVGCTGGNVMCGNGYCVDCVWENNVVMYPHGDVLGSNLATDEIKTAWQCRNNTFIVNPDHAVLYMGYENINTSEVYKPDLQACRINLPFTYRNVVFLTSNGVDPSGTFYYTNEESEHEAKGSFFMTGYHAERGGFELK